MSNELLVVPMHIPARGRLFLPASVLVALGYVIWIVLDPSWISVLLGSMTIIALVLVWGIVLTNRRVLHGRPMQIEVDYDGFRTAMWSIRWDQINRLWIGENGSTRWLNVEPTDPKSVERPQSVFYVVAAWLDRVFGLPAIRIAEMSIDRPLETLLGQLEAKSGRLVAVGPPYSGRAEPDR